MTTKEYILKSNMSKEPTEYLKHILDECSFILSVITSEK